MTTQAAPDFNAELARQTKATESAQALADHYKASADRLRAELDTSRKAHRMAERHVAELLLARSKADRAMGAMTGTIDQAIANLRAIVALNDDPHIDEICRATADALGALLGEKCDEKH